MREMKDSGIEWIGEIPKEWDAQRAKTLFRQRMSKGNTNTVLLAATQKYGMFPQHLLEGVVQVKEDTDFQTFKTVHTNDYVISLRSFQGGFEISEYEGVCSPAYQVFYNVKDIDFGFYRYLFKSDCFISKMNSLTVGIREGKNIQFSDFAKTTIPIPPLSDQHRIASYLDDKCGKIDRYIEQQKQVIEKLKAYKQSVITEAVTKGLDPTVPMKDSGVEWIGEIPEGWDCVPVKVYADILPGYAFSSEGFSTEKGMPLLRGVNVTPNGIRWEDTVYWNNEISANLNPFVLHKGDIVMGLDRPWVTDGTRITFVEQNNILLVQRVCKITAKNNMDKRWIYHWLDSDAFKQSVSIETTGVSVPHISTKQIENFIVSYPPFSEQGKISDYLDEKCYSIDFAIEKKQALIEKLTEYKKSLIYEVVTGKKEV